MTISLVAFGLGSKCRGIYESKFTGLQACYIQFLWELVITKYWSISLENAFRFCFEKNRISLRNFNEWSALSVISPQKGKNKQKSFMLRLFTIVSCIAPLVNIFCSFLKYMGIIISTYFPNQHNNSFPRSRVRWCIIVSIVLVIYANITNFHLSCSLVQYWIHNQKKPHSQESRCLILPQTNELVKQNQKFLQIVRSTKITLLRMKYQDIS